MSRSFPPCSWSHLAAALGGTSAARARTASGRLPQMDRTDGCPRPASQHSGRAQPHLRPVQRAHERPSREESRPAWACAARGTRSNRAIRRWPPCLLLSRQGLLLDLHRSEVHCQGRGCRPRVRQTPKETPRSPSHTAPLWRGAASKSAGLLPRQTDGSRSRRRDRAASLIAPNCRQTVAARGPVLCARDPPVGRLDDRARERRLRDDQILSRYLGFSAQNNHSRARGRACGKPRVRLAGAAAAGVTQRRW